MKRFLFAIPVALLLLVTPAFVSQDAAAQGADETELELHMKAINKAARTLRTALKNPERNAESLDVVLDMQEHALASKRLDSKMLGTIEGEEAKRQFTLEYRKAMHEFLGQMFDLEVALLEGRNDDAQAGLKAMLKGKGPAHEKFQLEEDR